MCADEGAPFDDFAVCRACEQVGFQVEAVFSGGKYPRVSTLFLQQHQEAQSLGIRDAEIIAGQDAHPARRLLRSRVRGEGL